ncbi:MAG: flagellar filament capping protein FliD [Methylomonas sp.]|jgi:flagellar hook-associated protein 2|uniref:flagellar filament capping protein FliD n=1 Tax=Methylomonas sp. TaxID=418 RepID=UPI0025E30826|nr:flagellar filament capping protein FliD [Methylomonas sp.]MCK9605228.1 flagellar filament capping protein FliD [Methylomonas sp.]
MIVSSTGIGSGIDIQSLVTQLATAEAQPALNAISRKTSAANTLLSGLGTLKSGLSDFSSIVAKLKDGNLFKTFKTTSSDESVLKATAASGAVAGSYAVEVVQLAKAQKSIAAPEFSNSSASIGSGTLTFDRPDGASFSVTTDNTTTLQGLRDAINQAAGNNFVTASIVNVDHVSTGPNDPDNGKTVSKLVLTAKDVGTKNGFTVSGNDDDGNNTDSLGISSFFSGSLQSLSDPLDAIIKVDQQTATRSSNLITDVLPGVNLDLQGSNVGETVDVQISLDEEAIKTTVQGFVDGYNKLKSTTKSLGKFGGATDGSGTGNGALLGDSTLRLVAAQIRQAATANVSSASGNYNSLAMIGISINRDGVMSLDSAKLTEALKSDIQSVSDVFSSADGVSTRMDSRLKLFLQSGGSLETRQNSLKKQISALSDQKLNVQDRQANYQAMLLRQFTAMDVTVGTLNTTSTFLSNWISKN